MSMRYSLKRLLLEQTSISQEQEQKISNLIAQYGTSSRDRGAEDIVAALLNGKNLNKEDFDFPFADVKVGDVYYSVKGTDKGSTRDAYNNADIKPGGWDKFKLRVPGAPNVKDAGLILVAISEDSDSFTVTTEQYGPMPRRELDRIFGTMEGKKSKRPAKRLWGEPTATGTYPIQKQRDTRLVSGISDALKKRRKGKITVKQLADTVAKLAEDYFSTT